MGLDLSIEPKTLVTLYPLVCFCGIFHKPTSLLLVFLLLREVTVTSV